MSLGIHTFFGYSISDSRAMRNGDAYLLGRFVGDTYADDEFENRLKRVTKRLTDRFGISGFNYCWSPYRVKEYKPMSDVQKYKRMVTKAYNEHKATVNKIIQDNSLFVDDFLSEQQKKLHNRIDLLKRRYNQ